MNNTNTRVRKKIIHVVQHLAPGGIENLTLELLRFAHPDDQLLIVSLEGNKSDAMERWPRLQEYQDKMVFLEKPPGVQFGLVLTLIKAFKGVRPDVVHTHHIGPLMYAGYAAKLAGVPVRIHTEHDAWHLNNNKQKQLQALLLKAAQPTIIADATHVKEQLDNHFRYSRTVVIKNGIDCKKFRPGSKELARQFFDLPKDALIVGCAGRLEKVKGHEIAIKAMTFLPQESLLVIAGDGSEREHLMQLSHSLKIEHRVRFLGQVEQMAHFYQALDVFCMPSLMEGMPLSLLEAQACNVRVVTTDVGASAEAVCPTTGQFIKTNDVAGTASTLLQVLLHNSTHQPRDFILQNFEIRKMAQAYHELALGELA